jgi:hypothetical protein
VGFEVGKLDDAVELAVDAVAVDRGCPTATHSMLTVDGHTVRPNCSRLRSKNLRRPLRSRRRVQVEDIDDVVRGVGEVELPPRLIERGPLEIVKPSTMRVTGRRRRGTTPRPRPLVEGDVPTQARRHRRP